MARYQEGKRYKEQSDKYIKSFTRDEFRAQKQMQGRRKAGDKLMARKNVERMRDLPKGQRKNFRRDNDLSYIGDAREKGSEYFDKGNLRKITEEDNPFNRSNEKGEIKYRGDEYGRRAQVGEDLISIGDLKGLKNVGGRSKQEIIDFTENTDARIAANAQNVLGRWKAAIIEAERERDDSTNPVPVGTLPGIDEVNNIDVVQGDDGMSNIGDGSQYQSNRTANNNRFDDASALTQGDGNIINTKNMEATDTGDIDILGDAWGDVVTGNLDKSLTFNYGAGLADSGYRPFTGDVAGYQALGERNFDENSGLKYGAMVTDYFTKNASRPVDSQGLREEADGAPLTFMDLATQFNAVNYGSGKNLLNAGRFVMPGEPEDLSNKLEELKEFGLV